ncbi:MAG: hypothetical protein IKU10_03975, partial [Clostridia bacterium]|nr:hypothetical protein [Clostridia bacterium]
TNPSNLFAIRQHIVSGREQSINGGVMVTVMETQRTRAVDYAGHVFNYIQQSPWRLDPAVGEIPPFCLSGYLK